MAQVLNESYAAASCTTASDVSLLALVNLLVAVANASMTDTSALAELLPTIIILIKVSPVLNADRSRSDCSFRLCAMIASNAALQELNSIYDALASPVLSCKVWHSSMI